MKSFLIKTVPILIFGIQTSLCFSEVRQKIGLDDADSLIYVVVVIFGLYLLNHYLTFLKPYAKFKKFESTKELIIDKQAEELISAFRSKKIPLRINIMGIERKLCSFTEPGKIFGRKICLFRKHLRPIWVSKNMDHSSDKDICLTINQGVSGLAIRQKSPALAFFDEDDNQIFNLNSKQLEKASDVKTIYSFPLREIDSKTRRISNKIIGTLNVDSVSDNSLKLKENDKLLQALALKTQALAENCSLII